MKKLIISENLFEELSLYNKGNMQVVHTSDDLHYVVKTPKQGIYSDRELELYELMNKHPTCFAEIYKIEPYEVWQEKLDEKKFKTNLEQLYNQFDKQEYFDYIPANFYNTSNEWNDAMLFAVIRDSNGDEFKKCVVNLSKPSFDFLKELINVLKEIQKLEPSGLEFDIHSGQFGYDKKNRIKCFDI